MGEQRAGSEVISRGGSRKVDGPRQSLDYVELSPLTQSSPQRARIPVRTPDRPAKQEELERDLAQRSEERRKWFEATDSRAPETPTGEGPRRSLGAPLTEDQQSRLSEEIEKKWQELEKLPLRESKRVPLNALLNQSYGERRGSPSDSHEALEKEVGPLPPSPSLVPERMPWHLSYTPTVMGSSTLICSLSRTSGFLFGNLTWPWCLFPVLLLSSSALNNHREEKWEAKGDHLLCIFYKQACPEPLYLPQLTSCSWHVVILLGGPCHIVTDMRHSDVCPAPFFMSHIRDCSVQVPNLSCDLMA